LEFNHRLCIFFDGRFHAVIVGDSGLLFCVAKQKLCVRIQGAKSERQSPTLEWGGGEVISGDIGSAPTKPSASPGNQSKRLEQPRSYPNMPFIRMKQSAVAWQTLAVM
jgi:hypothetical protein